jgi:hypothetical protein
MAIITVGNIVTENGLTGIPNNFIVMDFETFQKESNNQLPTLFIGWEATKKLLPETSILNKKIKDNLYWTFSSTEKRTIFENDLKSFITKSHQDFIKNIPFYSLDPIILKIKTTKDLLQKLQNFKESFTYLYGNRIVYIYYNSSIISLDLNLLKFISFDENEILEYLKKETKFFENKEKEFKTELKYFDIKYIPYLIYCDTTKNSAFSILH